MEKISPVIKAAAHRSAGNAAEGYREFAAMQTEKINQLLKEFPFLDFTPELKKFG
jgi:hypothetical protein